MCIRDSFESLEVGAESVRDNFEQAFGTPHDADIESIAAGFGAAYRRVESIGELTAALLDGVDKPEPVVVIEAATTRATRRALSERLKK